MTTTMPAKDASPTFPILPLGVLSVATFALVATELMPSAVLPTMSADLGVETSIGGLLVTAWAFTIVVTSLPMVRRLSTVRRRPLLAASLGVVAAANVATALAPTFSVAILARITAAGAHGLFWAIVVAHVASLVDTAKLGRALAIVLAGPTFSGLIGLPIGALVADRFGWRALFVGLAVLVASVATLVATFVPDALPSASGSPSGPAGSARQVLMTATSGGVVLVGHFAVFTFVVPIASGHVGAQAMPTVLLVMGVGGLVGTLFAGPIVDRWPNLAYPVAVAAIALTLAALTLATPFWVVLAIWGALIGLFPVALQTRVLAHASEALRDRAGAVVMIALNLGLAIGAGLGSVVTGVSTAEDLPLWAGAVAGTAFLPLLLARRRRRA